MAPQDANSRCSERLDQRLHPAPVARQGLGRTRPAGENGLGLTVVQAQTEMNEAERLFELLPDSPKLRTESKSLVLAHDVKRRNAHDARLIAAMNVHKIGRLLTFNASHFARFTDIEVLEPITIAANQPPPP